VTKPEDAPRLGDWLTATEISELLSVSRNTINKMIQSGEFATLHKIGTLGRPQFLVMRSEVLQIQKTRTFPRSGGRRA
jgi:excisionase family DNA binding protein